MGLRLENEALWGEGGEMMTSGHLGPAPPAGHHSTPHYHHHHPGECSLDQSWRKTGAPVSLSLAAGRDRGESGNHQRQGTIAPALHYTTLLLSSGISYQNIWTSIQRYKRQGATPSQTFCRDFEIQSVLPRVYDTSDTFRMNTFFVLIWPKDLFQV